MSAITRRRKYQGELRRVILDAAREILVREGYEKFSMRKLAGRIEYSPGSVYLHFHSKEELFRCLTDESFERLHKTLLEMRDTWKSRNPVEELRTGMFAYVNFGLRNLNDYRFVFMLAPPVEARPYKVHPAFVVLRQMVRRCVETAHFRKVDVETTAQALWSSVHGITSLLIQRPTFPWVSRKKLIAQVINTALASLIAEPRRQ
jgi:AcrR family transcriptional regulator